ncbi:MAG: hypothetical protein DSO07_01655 [Thermoproteota archaeon]|jgi:hypothetical protein|nr:MAG: hypothetical protein DSO07_01655 [Candidatus Korarchaeota archaeon]
MKEKFKKVLFLLFCRGEMNQVVSQKINKMALAALIMICLMFGAGFALTISAVYMETIERQPIHVIISGIGALLMTIATFIAIIQQKIERL